MDELQQRIAELEYTEKQQQQTLKLQWNTTLHSLRPSALISEGIRDVTQSKPLQQKAVSTMLGMGAGWAAGKLFSLGSKGIIRRFSAYLLKKAVTRFATRKLSRLTA